MVAGFSAFGWVMSRVDSVPDSGDEKEMAAENARLPPAGAAREPA
jgi:hypothetical protein